MLNTYQAILRDNHLEWVEKVPAHLMAGQAVQVYVTVLDQTPLVTNRGKRMAEFLERLAASNAFKDIDDPSEWQREIRKDRPLPGREE
jgi:hypothetical protein